MPSRTLLSAEARSRRFGIPRTNTFNDFVDVANGLIERGYTEAGKISIASPMAWQTGMSKP